ncbi:MAG: hypothetical protein KC561_05435 [Myxococcales bacterium]|nr:hypothetical protein [Myxococcales bacterium]
MGENTSHNEPRDSATVVMMREADGAPFEIFFVRRHAKSSFMANAHVFPGGRLDEEDCSDVIALHGRGFLPQDLAARLDVEEKTAIGLHVAAIREVFEESGALYATESSGDPIDLASEDGRDRYETYRVMLQDGEVDFEQIVGWEDLCLRFDELTYFARWITPEFESKRYDARFFLAKAPDNQRLIHDDKETTDSAWYSPAQALKAYEAGEIQLAPPTKHILEHLSTFESIDAAIAYFSETEIPTVRPQPESVDGVLTLLFPGDPAYPDQEALGVHGATRYTLQDGKWTAPNG